MRYTAKNKLQAMIDARNECVRLYKGPNSITLDGHPAKITGWTERFANVVRMDGKYGNTEFAWQTVQRILEKGGAFNA